MQQLFNFIVSPRHLSLVVVIFIFFPQTVTVFLDKPIEVDLKTIRIEVPPNDLQQPDDQTEQDTVNNLMRDLMKNTPQAK